jgi:hypothetical protein
MAAAAANAIATLKANADSGILGYFVWWGTWEALIAPEALRGVFQDAGLNPGVHVPDDPTPALAFRRAVNHGISGQKGVTSKLIADTDAQITYALREDVVNKETSRAPARQFARITWIPGRNKVISDRADHPVVRRIIASLPMFRDNHTSDDVRKAIKSVLREADAVAVAGRGGNSCFAPVYAGDLIEKLTTAVSQVTDRDGLTGQQTFVAGPCPEGSEWQRIGEAAGRSEFGSKVDKAEADLIEFQERMDAHLKAVNEAESKGEDYTATGPRLGSLASKLGEYKELRAKIESFSAALSFRAEDMLDKLDGVRITVSDLLGD